MPGKKTGGNNFKLFEAAIANHPLIKKNIAKKYLKILVNDFKILYEKYQDGATGMVDWDKIKPLLKKDVIDYVKLNKNHETLGNRNMKKVVMIKLNGGMGTSMGCTGTKSVLSVDGIDSFLSKIIKQTQKKRVALMFMNSVNTDEETKSELKDLKYKPTFSDLKPTFLQNIFPRIDAKTNKPLRVEGHGKWYRENFVPPGHIDIFRALRFNGLIKKLLSHGYRYAFIANADNLAAMPDPKILGHMIKSKKDFIMQTTSKTKADVKGGTLIRLKTEQGDRLFLLERAQCPAEHLHEFEDIKKFKVFNTNSVWVDIKALDKIINKVGINGITDQAALIVAHKKVLGKPVVQLEQAIGSSISLFANAGAVNRGEENREKVFMPIKKTDDFFRLISDYIDIDDHGFITKNPARKLKSLPLINMDERYYKDINEFLKRVDYGVSLVHLKSLTIKGDFYIKSNVKFVGTVEIINKTKKAHVIEGETLRSGIYEVKKGKLEKSNRRGV